MRPTNLPAWATDDAYDASGKSWDALDPKLEPSAGQIAEGWEPGQAPNARHMNWLLNLLCRWIAYVEPGVLNGWEDVDATVPTATVYRVVLAPRPNGGSGAAWCIAGGDGANCHIVTSKTGINLTARTFPVGPTTRFLSGIRHEYGGGTSFVYVLGSESGHIITRSSDPTGAWTLVTSGVEGANLIKAFAQNDDGSVLLALTDHTTTSGILRSTDHGATWTSVDPGGAAAGVDIVWTGTKFLASFVGGGTRTSTDGATWGAGTAIPTVTATTLVTDGDGTVVAYPLTSGASYRVSDDHGVSWGAAQVLSHELAGGAITGDRGRMIYHEGLWILAFGGSTGILSSPTALEGTWRAHVVDSATDLLGGQFYALAYGQGRYLAAGGYAVGPVSWVARTPCFAGGRRGFPGPT